MIDALLTCTFQKHALGRISATTDMWSDPNLTPFMAVTIHWMEGISIETPNGTQKKIQLQSDLIGFVRVPGKHTGKHLMTAFLYVFDHLRITHRVRLSNTTGMGGANLLLDWMGHNGQRQQ